MRKREFVSGSLHAIRDKISESTNVDSTMEKLDADQERPQGKSLAESKPAEDKSLKKALAKRRAEFLKVRRDVISRLAEVLAVIPDDIKAYESRAEESRNVEDAFNKITDELTALDDSAWDEENYSAQLGDAMKKVEDSRLQFIRTSAKLERLKRGAEVSDSTITTTSSLLELTSLSFKQLFRLGLIFYLPLLVAVLIAGFCVAIAIVLSMST